MNEPSGIRTALYKLLLYDSEPFLDKYWMRVTLLLLRQIHWACAEP